MQHVRKAKKALRKLGETTPERTPMLAGTHETGHAGPSCYDHASEDPEKGIWVPEERPTRRPKRNRNKLVAFSLSSTYCEIPATPSNHRPESPDACNSPPQNCVEESSITCSSPGTASPQRDSDENTSKLWVTSLGNVKLDQNQSSSYKFFEPRWVWNICLPLPTEDDQTKKEKTVEERFIDDYPDEALESKKLETRKAVHGFERNDFAENGDSKHPDTERHVFGDSEELARHSRGRVSEGKSMTQESTRNIELGSLRGATNGIASTDVHARTLGSHCSEGVSNEEEAETDVNRTSQLENMSKNEDSHIILNMDNASFSPTHFENKLHNSEKSPQPESDEFGPSYLCMVWREIDCDDPNLTVEPYLQSADIVLISIDAKANDPAWIDCAEFWMKEALDSNIGNLYGIVFLVQTAYNSALPENFFQVIKNIRRKFEFKGAVIAHALHKGGCESGANKGSMFTKENFEAVVDISISYIMKCCQKSVLSLRYSSTEYVNKRQSDASFISDDFYKVKVSKNPVRVLRQCDSTTVPQSEMQVRHIHRYNEVILASEGFTTFSDHVSDEHTSVKTAIWDYKDFEYMRFSFLFFVEALSNMILFVYVYRAIVRWIGGTFSSVLRGCCSWDVTQLGFKYIERGNKKSARQREFTDTSEVNKLRKPPNPGGSLYLIWHFLWSRTRLSHKRSFWGAGKGLFVRNPWQAVARQTTTGHPVALNDRDDWSCTTRCKFLGLFFMHCVSAALMGFAIYYSFREFADHSTSHIFTTTAHRYITLFAGVCLLYAAWSATFVFPNQASRVRQCSTLAVSKTREDLAERSKLIERVHLRELQQGGNILKQSVSSLLYQIGLDKYVTTEEVENSIVAKARKSLSGYRRNVALAYGAVVVALHTGTAIISRIWYGKPLGMEGVSSFDTVILWAMRLGSGVLMGVAVFMILYLAGGTAAMCLETMKAVTKLLAMKKKTSENPTQEGENYEHETRQCCGTYSQRTTKPTPFNVLPVIPLNIYAWIHIRQNLFYLTQAAFAESSFVLLLPVMMIAFAIGHLILVAVKGDNIALSGAVVTDAVYAALTLLFVCFKASRLQREHTQQVRLLGNHQTAVGQLEDHLRRLHIRKNHDAWMRQTGTVETLQQTSKALAIVRETVRDTVLGLTVWPGILLSQRLLLSIIFGFFTVLSTILGYTSDYFSHKL
eukprot:gb/GECG01000376.1/.p1 GENE.gb/GECG01000376.1/~~gb/GECG01000376.1/.p1  ORF type:complete len:1182 (+),score=110.94 gb/GECG01000376.1/:1-3546(+)